MFSRHPLLWTVWWLFLFVCVAGVGVCCGQDFATDDITVHNQYGVHTTEYLYRHSLPRQTNPHTLLLCDLDLQGIPALSTCASEGSTFTAPPLGV